MAKKLRVSIVQYLNTAPLVYGFTHGPLKGKYELSFTIPSRCADDLRDGNADVAIIPAIEFQRIDNLVVLPDLAIAAKRRVRSLLIVSRKPIAEVKSIALDHSSRSTQALTRILCAEHWHITPDFHEATLTAKTMLENSDAALLIGDPALRLAISHRQLRNSWPRRRIDLRRRENRRRCHRTFACVRRGSGMAAVERPSRRSGDLGGDGAKRLAPEVMADFAASRDYGVAHIRGNQRRRGDGPGLARPGSAHVPAREHQLQSEPRKSCRAGTLLLPGG